MALRRSMGKNTIALLLAIIVSLALPVVRAMAHDIPDEILLHAFVKPERDRLHFLVRVPLTLLLNLNLPKRGLGYLDLARIDEGLQRAAAATAKDIDPFEHGRRLTPARAEARISLPSDRSFETYAGALAHIHGPTLPENTDVFWNQGFFDAHLEYPIRSDRADFSLHFRVAPGLGQRLKMAVRFMPPDGPTRAYRLTGGSDLVALDPRWHQAAWVFVKSGFSHILDGIDHLLFLCCLVIPFRRRWWDLLKVISSFTVARSITLIASACNMVPAGQWFPPLVEALIALSIVYMALENIVAASLRRRWLITGAFGLVHGFGFSFALKQNLQFAGNHLLLSLLSFNVGVELGQVLVLLLVIPVLWALFQHLVAERLGTVIPSVLVAHTGWRWMLERMEKLRWVDWPIPDVASTVTMARWALVVLLVAGAAWISVGALGRHPAEQRPRGEDIA